MERKLEFLQRHFYGNTVADWIVALGFALLVLVGLRLLQRFGIRNLRRLADKVHLSRINPFLEAIEKTQFLVLLILSLYAGCGYLDLPARLDKISRVAALIAILFQTGLWGGVLVDGWLTRYRRKYLATNPGAVTTMGAMSFVIKAMVWVCLILLVLENAGMNISALVTGLGIGGVAIALAVQHILSDIFGSLTIMMDKPFAVGDSLTVGDYQGNVEHVGLKTTRLRSVSGEQIIVSNSDLLGSRIRNYGRMFERRVQVDIGVAYDTPREKIVLIPQIIRDAIAEHDKTRTDRAHFTAFGAYSLKFEYVYYVRSADYNLYMDIQQAINLRLHERFEKEGIKFAFPTQTLYITENNAKD